MIPNSGSSLQTKTVNELSARRLVYELKSLGAVLMADDLRRYHDQMLDIAERLADEEERLCGDREHLRLELRELRTEIDRQRRMLSDIRTLRGELAIEDDLLPPAPISILPREVVSIPMTPAATIETPVQVVTPMPVETRRAEEDRIEAERMEANRIDAARREAARIEIALIEAQRLEAARMEARRMEEDRLAAERIQADRLEAMRLEEERAQQDQAREMDVDDGYDSPNTFSTPTLTVIAPLTGRRAKPSVQSLFGKTQTPRTTQPVRPLRRSGPASASGPVISKLMPVGMPARSRLSPTTTPVEFRTTKTPAQETSEDIVDRLMEIQPPPIPMENYETSPSPLLDEKPIEKTLIERKPATEGSSIPFFETPIRSLNSTTASAESEAQPETEPATSEPSAEAPVLRPMLRRRNRPFRPDIQVKVRWWNAVPVLLAVTGAATMMLWASTSSLQASMAVVKVQDSIERLPKDRRKITDPIIDTAQVMMGRWDADRSYICARGMALTAEPGAKTLTAVEQNERQQAAYYEAARAVRISPANRWFRMTLAQLAERMSDATAEREQLWTNVVRQSSSEPLYWRSIAQHLQATGKISEALAAYQKYLGGQPEQTTATLKQLNKDGLKFEQLNAALPASVIACAAAAEFYRQEGFPNWQQAARDFADKFPEDIKHYRSDEWAARASLLKMTQRIDEAIASFERALAKSGKRNDWRIQLAKLHYEKGLYPECERLANIVLQTEPASDVADQARLLKERIALATGKSLMAKPAH